MTSRSTAGIADFADHLQDVLPMVGRAARLDPRCPVRVRVRDGGLLTVLLRLPFSVLAGRSVSTGLDAAPLDATYAAAEFVAWLESGGDGAPPQQRDAEWRWPVPPATGWVRVETVPSDVIRGLVQAGGRTVAALKDAESHSATLRPQAADALLDTAVLTATDGLRSADVRLRQCAAATRLGFLPPGSSAAVDVSGRWTRLAGAFGSVFAERPGSGLALL